MNRQQQGTGSVVESQATETAQTLAVVQQFCDAFNRQDLDAIMAVMTEDCVLESIYPYPDGTRYAGPPAVRARWAEVFRTSPDLWYETEEMFAVADRCIFRWIGHRRGQDGQPDHYRGVDILRVRDGRVAEKLVYAKR